MNHVFRISMLVLPLILSQLSGCAVQSQNLGWRGVGLTYQSAVKTLPNGDFYVEAEAAPLAGRQSGAETVTAELAADHCKQRQRKVTVVDKSVDSHLLINGVSRLTFRCE